MADLNGKTALVTGASRGIGAAVLSALTTAGAHVVGTAVSDVGVAKIREKGGVGVLYDATAAGAAEALAAQLISDYKSVDIVVANAAINQDGILVRMKSESWAQVLDANLTSIFLLTKGLLRPMMKKGGGRIIAVSSVVASIGNFGQANYCAAKAGLEGYCRAMAKEVATRNITVNAVAPGFIGTDMTEKLPQEVKDKFISAIPAGRVGTAAEVANAVEFLASDAAAYITGQVLHVNGGLYMG